MKKLNNILTIDDDFTDRTIDSGTYSLYDRKNKTHKSLDIEEDYFKYRGDIPHFFDIVILEYK